MESVNFVMLGEQSAASKFGKKGTSTDLTLYDKKESDIIRTWIAPTGFPEKIQPLLQAVNLAEYAVFHIGSLDRFAGEQVIALDTLGVEGGILSHTYEIDESRLDAMIRGTVLERYRRTEPEKMRETMAEFAPVPGSGGTKVVVDHSFNVGGVGTVVLAKVFAGSIKRYDNLRLLPSGREVMIKSIQMHDDDVVEARSPARVGLLLKNVRPDEVGRGDVLCEGDIPVRTEIELDFQKSPFYRGDVVENQVCLLSIGLQIKPARFSSTDPVRLALEKPVVCSPGETCVVLRPESPGTRIMGHGLVG